VSGPLASYVQLPADTGNLGKKVRTLTRQVGGDTVHEHYFVGGRRAEVLGVYRAALAQQTVLQAAQNGTTTGFLWLHVPAGVSGKRVRIRAIRVDSQHSTALATPTAPRLSIQRFTFTGTASWATVTPGKNDSDYPAPVLDLRTASTGLSVVLGASMAVVGICGALTAVGAWAPNKIEVVDVDDEDEWIVLSPGEGLVVYQETGGTASDTRKVNISLVWDEVDVG
jgi:hypothetical protein